MLQRKPDLNSGKCYHYKGWRGKGWGKDVGKASNAKIIKIWAYDRSLRSFHATGKQTGEYMLSTESTVIHCLFNMYLWIFPLESLRGFIHNLSRLVKHSKKTGWFEFQMQTSPSKIQRVVGFNVHSHSTFSEHNEPKTPVLLSNAKKNDSNKDIIFNQQSGLRQHSTLTMIILQTSPHLNHPPLQCNPLLQSLWNSRYQL